MPKQVTSYIHRDKPCRERWQPGYFAAYCEARSQAIRTALRADALYHTYLHGNRTDEEDAHLVQSAEWLDRLAYAYWREAVRLWNGCQIIF